MSSVQSQEQLEQQLFMYISMRPCGASELELANNFFRTTKKDLFGALENLVEKGQIKESSTQSGIKIWIPIKKA